MQSWTNPNTGRKRAKHWKVRFVYCFNQWISLATMVMAGRCLEASFCLPDAEGTWRMQASPDEICFSSMQKWVLHISGMTGVVIFVVLLPALLQKQLLRIKCGDRWEVPDEQVDPRSV